MAAAERAIAARESAVAIAEDEIPRLRRGAKEEGRHEVAREVVALREAQEQARLIPPTLLDFLNAIRGRDGRSVADGRRKHADEQMAQIVRAADLRRVVTEMEFDGQDRAQFAGDGAEQFRSEVPGLIA